MFKDRKDAGRKLAAALDAYKDKKDVMVLAVADTYRKWYDVPDEEVIAALKKKVA